MNEMIKAERNKICSRKQTRMLFLAGVVLIVAYFFFFQFNYQNVFYDYDLEKMALASGFTAIEQRKEVAEIFEGKLSQNTLLTMQEKIDQAKQATVGQDENSAFSAVHVYRDQAAILEYLTNSDGSFKSLETAYPNSPTVTLGYCDGWDKLLSGMGSILSIMICLIVVITLSPVFSEEYALHTDSIIYSARYGRTKLTTSKIIAALEVVIGTYLLYLLLNLVLYGCTYGLQGCRGTSTFDGLSIAWAVIEHISNPRLLGAKTLFATHYHELTELEGTINGVNNYCIAVKEQGDDIVFLRKIVKGGADKSYGIQVAKLAGVPDSVIQRAKELVEELSSADITAHAREIAQMSASSVQHKAVAKPDEVDLNQMSIFDTVKDDDIIKELGDLELSTMTPIDALNTLYRLQTRLKNRWQ